MLSLFLTQVAQASPLRVADMPLSPEVYDAALLHWNTLSFEEQAMISSLDGEDVPFGEYVLDADDWEEYYELYYGIPVFDAVNNVLEGAIAAAESVLKGYAKTMSVLSGKIASVTSKIKNVRTVWHRSKRIVKSFIKDYKEIEDIINNTVFNTQGFLNGIGKLLESQYIPSEQRNSLVRAMNDLLVKNASYVKETERILEDETATMSDFERLTLIQEYSNAVSSIKVSMSAIENVAKQYDHASKLTTEDRDKLMSLLLKVR